MNYFAWAFNLMRIRALDMNNNHHHICVFGWHVNLIFVYNLKCPHMMKGKRLSLQEVVIELFYKLLVIHIQTIGLEESLKFIKKYGI